MTRRWLCDLLLLLQSASPYEVSVPILKGKTTRGAHISMILPDEQLDVRLSSFRCSSSNKTHKLNLSFSVALSQKSTPISCLTSFMSYVWIIESRKTDMNRSIMSFFTPVSNSVVLTEHSFRVLTLSLSPLPFFCCLFLFTLFTLFSF